MAKKKVKKKKPWWQLPASSLTYRNRMLLAVALGIVAFLLYAPSLQYEYTFDDDVYLNKNEITQGGLNRIGDIFGKGSVYGFSGENTGTWRPVTLLSFALEKQLGKTFQPRRSHLFSLILYGITAFVLFLVLIRMLPKHAWLLSLLITLLFVVHPIHSEVVANVKGREEILAFLFLLISLWSLSNASRARYWSWFGLAGLSYVLAILSKENAYTFAPLFPLFVFLFTDKRKRKLWMTTAVFFAIAIFFFGLRSLVLDTPPQGSGVSDPFVNNFILAADGFGNQLATILLVLGKYVQLLFFPHPLRYDYSFAQFSLGSWGNPLIWLTLILYLAIGLIGLHLLRKRSPLAWGPLYYLITIAIAALSPLLLRDVAALGERFLYTPSWGFCMILVLGLYAGLQAKTKVNNLRYLYVGLGILILLGIVKTRNHLPVWKDNETLFRHGVEVSPNSFRTHLNLAETLRTRAELSNQESPDRRLFFQEALRAYEQSISIYDGEGTTWYNLGICYMNLGQVEQALNAFQKAIDRDKLVGDAANNIGVIYFRQNSFAEAARYFRIATEAEPQNANHMANLGLALKNSGQTSEAVQVFQQALNLDPNQALAKQQLELFGY